MWSSTSDLVERLCPLEHESLPELRQMPVGLLFLAWQQHGPHALNAIPAEQTVTIDPQPFTQGFRITRIGLVDAASQRLDHQCLVTPLILLEPSPPGPPRRHDYNHVSGIVDGQWGHPTPILPSTIIPSSP